MSDELKNVDGLTVRYQVECYGDGHWYCRGFTFDNLAAAIRGASTVSPKNARVRIVCIVTTRYVSETYSTRKAIDEAAKAMKENAT